MQTSLYRHVVNASCESSYEYLTNIANIYKSYPFMMIPKRSATTAANTNKSLTVLTEIPTEEMRKVLMFIDRLSPNILASEHMPWKLGNGKYL